MNYDVFLEDTRVVLGYSLKVPLIKSFSKKNIFGYLISAFISMKFIFVSSNLTKVFLDKT